MKIGVILTGVSYSVNDSHHAWRNYEHCIDNILGGIGYLKNNNHDISVYLCTYNSEKIYDIVERYNAKKCIILPKHERYFKMLPQFSINGGSSRCMVSTYYESLSLLENEDLDFVIITRFDIWFKQNIFKKFDYNKFNFLFKHADLWENVTHPSSIDGDTSWHFTSDCLHAFPISMKNDFKDTIYEMLGYDLQGKINSFRTSTNTLHNLYNFLTKRISTNTIHFCFDKLFYNVGNDIFNLIRVHKSGLTEPKEPHYNLLGKLPQEYHQLHNLKNDFWE